MGGVDQGLEFFRRAEAAAQGEEIRHLVAEAPVVGMLLQGHDLQSVVSRLDDTRKHLLPEFGERSHLLFLGTHADVHLVDERIGDLRTAFLTPAIGFLRFPDLGAEKLRIGVLHAAGRIGGDAFSPAPGPFDEPFVEVAVRYLFRGHAQFPVPSAKRLQGPLLIAVPGVEISQQIDFRGIGRPLPEHPLAFLPVETIVQGAVDGVFQGLSRSGNLLLALEDTLVATFDHLPEGRQPRVFLPDFHRHSFFISFSISSWLPRM